MSDPAIVRRTLGRGRYSRAACAGRWWAGDLLGGSHAPANDGERENEDAMIEGA
jgi:hypothetical protein